MTRYWAGYGRTGFLGIFEGAAGFHRGAAVAVQSPRGREVVAILELVDERIATAMPSDGTIHELVAGTCDDAADLLKRAEAPAAALPVLIPDAGRLLDGTLILHVMPWDAVDLTAWVEGLSREFGCPVMLLNLAELPREKVEAGGCGKPNCGDGGGGCSTGGCGTGSCSKGSVKNADELTAYFAGLRTQMESRRTSLA